MLFPINQKRKLSVVHVNTRFAVSTLSDALIREMTQYFDEGPRGLRVTVARIYSQQGIDLMQTASVSTLSHRDVGENVMDLLGFRRRGLNCKNVLELLFAGRSVIEGACNFPSVKVTCAGMLAEGTSKQEHLMKL